MYQDQSWASMHKLFGLQQQKIPLDVLYLKKVTWHTCGSLAAMRQPTDSYVFLD
jgi:hypothetical protein